MVGIYKITSPTGKIYVGQTWNIEKRVIHYKYQHCRYQRKIYNSIKKYDWKAHSFDVLHELPSDITQQVLDLYESYYLQQFLDCGFEVLNLREPGSKGKLSKETIAKIKESWTEDRRRIFAESKMGELNVSKREEVKSKKREAILKKPRAYCTECNKIGYVHHHFDNCKVGKRKAKPRAAVKCPYCEKELDPGNAKRYHFNNCKFKN